ncbi:class I SAM-dependent methyltransferase [Zavarzinella formosa]|uniref:class I SAM-dependent methyltransferase n=1 Tax=Zavarzinella formosa TaxID=360055 RepID=UPI000381E950|nr:class I SAM-dependent methyltransferase [Zavarzinella formosa]
MKPPCFDILAPHYVWIEAVTFGGLLQWCRTALVDQLTEVRRVLVLGEGDGRFVNAFLLRNPNAALDVVDASPEMVARARQRLTGLPGARNVRWHVGDARRFEPDGPPYDLIVTNFFLDCLTAAELQTLVERLARHLEPGGRWLVGDFALPASRLKRIGAHAALAVMYLCFKVVTRIPAGRLEDPGPVLLAHGLTPEQVEHRLGGFLVASLWRRSNG